MKITILIALLFVFKISVTKTNDHSAVIKSSADKTEQKVIDWRHDIHKNPELGNRETRTAALIAKHLESLGIEVKTGAEVTGAEDFSSYAQKVPDLYFFVGGLTKGKDQKTSGPHYTPEFLLDDSSFKTGVVAFCNLVFDYEEMNTEQMEVGRPNLE